MVVEEAKLLYTKEHSPDLKQGRKSIYFGDFEERSLPRLILIFFHRPSLRLPTLDITVLVSYDKEHTAQMVYKAWILL